MKKQLALIIAILMVLLSDCHHNSEIDAPTTVPETTLPMNYEALYQPILDRVVELIDIGDAVEDLRDGEVGISEAIRVLDPAVCAESIGYALEDISGDGIPELLIGDITRHSGDASFGQTLYTIYTCKDAQPVLALEGWARNNYRLMDNRTLLNLGSNGAMYAIWSTLKLSADGTAPEYLDYYFTYEKDNDYTNIGYYHNITGEWNPEQAEKMEISEEQFWNLYNDAENRVREIPFRSFSLYGREKLGSFVRVQYEADLDQKPDVCTEFHSSDSDIHTGLVFRAYGLIKDFKLLSLQYQDMDENAMPIYEIQEVYSSDMLSENRPLIAEVSFFGTIPNNGFSYTNDQGITRTYALDISGYDGRLIISPLS